MKPGRPIWTPLKVPSWPPALSAITVPEVSSMCHSATRTAPGAGRAGEAAARGRAGRRDRDGAEAGEHHREQRAKAHIVEYVR